MNDKEKDTLQSLHLTIVQDLDVKEILPHLFQNKMITFQEYEEFDQLKETRSSNCRKLLRTIVQPGSKCTFEGFIQALRYNNAYSFLAKTIEKQLAETIDNGIGTCNQNPETNTTGQTNIRSDIVYEPVRKINVFTKKRKVISTLSSKLKKLSHDGDIRKFEEVVTAINTKFKNNKLNMLTNITDRMHLADMKFATIEAEISAKRVKFDKSLSEGDIFRHMESVIPFTSNPRVSSMSYLARYGSAIAMKDSIDDGLAYIQFAKEHAEHVSPCKDTGMVYYIEVNLLTQKYEKNPSDHLKANILQMSELGINQFSNESEEVKKDYQRMLLLKMVFCYLGVGLFCKKIENAKTTERDIEQAKNLIDFIETSDIWQGMEKRRKMLFYVAKSEFYKQQGNLDLAVVHASEAHKLGCENNWLVELKNISEMVEDLKRRDSSACRDSDTSDDDILAELFEDIPEQEDESGMEMNYLKSTSNLDDSNLFDIQNAIRNTRDMETEMLSFKRLTINQQMDRTSHKCEQDHNLNGHNGTVSAFDLQGTDKTQMMNYNLNCTTCAHSDEHFLLELKEVNLNNETETLPDTKMI